MKYHYPAYYRRFICTGGACEDTCCGGWHIGIDNASYRNYKNTPGIFGRRLQQGIDHKNRVFRLHGRQCTFLNEDGFCDIYRELGRSMMCRTCRTYPRHVEDYGDLQEVMLSLSCPEAARLILNDPDYGAFLEKERPGTAKPLRNQRFLMVLLEVRQTIVTILRDQRMGWEERLAMVLAFAHDMQRLLPESRGGIISKAAVPDSFGADAAALTARYLAPHAPERFGKRIASYRNRGNEQFVRTAAWIREAAGLEAVVEDWRRSQERLCRNLYHGMDMGAYQRCRNEFSSQTAAWEREWENLVLYFVHTFFLGAVYDGDMLGKIKLALFSYVIIRENCLETYRKGKTVDTEQLVAAAYRYSREVENSDANLETLERWFDKGRLFGMDSMMTVLLG